MATSERKGFRLNIRAKLLTVTGLLGVGAITLVAATMYFMSARALERKAFDQLASIGSTLKSNIEAWYNQVRAEIANQAESLTVRNAIRDLSAARKSLLKDVESSGQPVDSALLDEVTAANRQYYQEVLIANLRKVRTSDQSRPDDFRHPDPEANLLQYTYTVKNPSAVGSKFEKNDANDIAGNSAIAKRLRDALSQTSYAKSHSLYHPILQQLVHRYGYYDVFLCDNDGNVVYTVFKELDFQGNLKTGPQTKTGLGEAFRLAMSAERGDAANTHVRITDFAPYAASYDAPASFISCPIFGDDGAKLGAIVYQLPVDRINSTMTLGGRQKEVGLGESGESYLVGADFVQRTNSRFMEPLEEGKHKRKTLSSDGKEISFTSIGVLKVDTEGARLAFSSDESRRNGELIYNDYRGLPVLGSYSPLTIPGVRYAILTEIDEAEAFAAVRSQATAAMGVGVGALVVFALVSIFFARQLTRPMANLVEVADKVAAGDDSARATVSTSDEIGDLGRQFNAMVEARVKTQRAIQDENRRLQENIRDLLEIASEASDGNLAVRAKVTEGALGNVADALNLMFENVGDLIKEVQAASIRVASASSQIQVASEQLAHGAQKQSEEVVNTTAAVQEMASNIESVANNATVAAQAGQKTKEASDAGQQSVSRVIESMNKIRENVLAGAKKIKRLGDRSLEISTIVNTIQEISGQTDMLALNAAIEAARAGEHGRGFSVVAEEVRKLAERTAAATREIEKLIAGIQAETNEAVKSMEEQTMAVETQNKLVSGAGDSLANIRQATEQSADLINEINLSAKQQVRGANGVVQAMSIVADIAKQAQSGAEQTKTSTEELAGLATELTKTVTKFKVTA